MAKLYFRYGAMNSGKSTALIQVAHNYVERGMIPKILKPKVDTKGNGSIVSRIGASKEVDFLIEDDENIFMKLLNENFDCLLVDEVQFLKSEHIDQLLEIVVKRNIPVICYGLRTDFKRNGFEGSQRLLLIAHTIEELKTVCRCGAKAIFNARKIDDKFVFDGEQLAIDGAEVTYESICPSCYNNIICL